MIILHPTCQKYAPYPISPSAFRWIEWPLAALDKEFKSSLAEFAKSATRLTPLIRIQAQAALLQFKNGNYPLADKALKIAFIDSCELLTSAGKVFGILYGSLAISSLVLCLTPVTFIADIVSGTQEVRVAFRKCYPKEHIDLIIKKKWIASATQHLGYFVINALFFRCAYSLTGNRASLARRYFSTVLSVPLVFVAALIVTFFFSFIISIRHVNGKAVMLKTVDFIAYSLCSLPVYRFSILFTLNYLPQWTQPGKFSIFIDNPSNWLENEDADEDDLWANYAISDRTRLTARSDGTEFGNFLNRFKEGVSPQLLLQIPDEYTEDEMNTAFRKWALIFHPDKTKDPDAEALFKALRRAYEILKRKFEVPAETKA